jgi:transcriptional regulator with XRE-family HTH domain
MFRIIGILADTSIMRYMPAKSPEMSATQTHQLGVLGRRLKDRRKSLRLSAAICAEAAGVSRVTLHRIEAGNPSVTMGSYLNVIGALGLTLTVPLPEPREADAPARIKVGDHPGLRSLAWQLGAGVEVSEPEALNLYERGWRHLDQGILTDGEKLFIQHLADTYSHGTLLV